jgi:hypothetical protein
MAESALPRARRWSRDHGLVSGIRFRDFYANLWEEKAAAAE